MNTRLNDVVFSGIVSVRDRLLQLANPLRLESGEPDFDTPAHITEAMARALADHETHYAPSTGIKPLKEAVLRKVAGRNGISYVQNPNHVLIVNGGMHGLYCTFQTILNAGDEVIMPRPNWTATAWMVRLAGATTVFCDLLPEREYRWDAGQLESLITSRTRAVLINTPHNPTGGVMRREDLRDLLELAARHNLWVISDEAYEDIIYDQEHVSIAALAADYPEAVRAKIVSCYTFSKSYAMTGWRLGYLVCPNDAFVDQIKKMILYTINGVSTATQYAGVAALDGPQEAVAVMREEYRKRRDLLYQGVNASPLMSCDTPPAGAFYLYARITDEWRGSAWDLVNHLIERYAMGSVPGDVFYDSQKSIRFSYACSTAMIREAIERLTAPVAVG
ncbi:MAG: aminotransferase class I/II-fold pyridoxal phosphate-dependent enzyme [candidate division Zixibacteria bacterium]|nr:aminotransferase class I/II-fold pyridoxal phosphate-dependent enzyme [candidate division Zixibacteria bacterium]